MTRFISEMSYPTTILLGPGAVARLGPQCKHLRFDRPLVITDKGIVESGVVERVVELLKAEGLQPGLFDGVVANPSEKDVDAAVEAQLAHGSDSIVAVGGGSVIDTAKLVRLMVTHEPPLARYGVEGDGGLLVTGKVSPMIAVPSSAGAGSEVSRFAAVLIEETGRKVLIGAPSLMPDVAICDPELTVGLPPGPTAWSGMVAFSHCIESFCAAGLHPLADALAIDGIARCARSLVKTVEEPANIGARTEMMIAAIEGAAASEKGLGACNALANAVSAVAGVRHGLATAICLGPVLELNRPAIGGRLAKMALALGESVGASQESLAAAAVDRVLRLTREANIPSGLKEAGILEEQLAGIAEKASRDASLATNPRELSGEDMLVLVRDAF
ncbi:MAG TPA: alcohol dehydrogenase [Myxococcales bacterium]|nr:alcohol dehydrogenase [Myxococcales bacterium]